jgi:K+-transporting ATPase ATPase C chain
MKTHLLPAIKLTVLCLILFSVVYPAIIWGVARTTTNEGKGDFDNIGQTFTQDKYFWSRPSAVGYNAAGSAGSNKGPSNPNYLVTVQARIDTFLVHNPTVSKSDIPSELVTASGSGLDPHISLRGALVQIARVSKVRGIKEGKLNDLVVNFTEKPLLGIFGTYRVNVLKLNQALDRL